jgi:hypothetical protein
VLGLIIGVVVLAASAHDNAAGTVLLDLAAERCRNRLEKALVDQAFRVRELHELLGMPTDDPAMNVTRSCLGRLTRQGFLTQPGRGLYKKRT